MRFWTFLDQNGPKLKLSTFVMHEYLQNTKRKISSEFSKENEPYSEF